VKGLGLVPITLCPHYDGEQRDKSFQAMIKDKGGMGVALDNNCAIEILDDRYRIITSAKKANAYKVYRQQNKVIQDTIEKSAAYKPLKALLNN